MPHTILDPVPLDQLVTRRVMTFTDAIRTVKSILFTVIPFEEGIPFWGKEIRQGTELKNGARTTQVKIGIFQYNTTTNQVLFLQGSCETTCMKGRISLQIKRTGRFDSNFCQESYNAPMLAMAFSNDELQQRLSPEDFTYKEFRNGKPYFFKEGLFHVGHFQQGIWIEYAPEHSLGEQAIFRAYKGEISVKLMTDSNGEQFWSEFFHDPMGVRFIQHCNGIRMHVGFKNDKPLHEWFYLIQLQNNQLYSISLQAKTSQWTLVRQSPDVYAFCLDADGMEVDRAFAIRQFQKIEADLRAFQLVAVNEPNACLPQTVECEKGEAFLPVALSALALTEKESESLVKQLVLLIQFGKDEYGCLLQGNIDDNDVLQGDVILDEIRRENTVLRVEGFYEDGEILRGKVTQTSTDKLGITEGRYDGSHFIGTCTICDWKTKEQVSFKGRFPRRQDLSTFDVEVTGPHKLSNVTLKKYDISQPEYTPDGRLFYEYVGEIQSGVPHGYGTHKYWNRENTMCFVSSGDFILGRMQTRGKITAYIVSESAGVAPLKVPTTSSTYSTYELDIDAKSKTLASISAMEPGTSLSTTQWTLTRRPNGTMYYQSSTRKGAVKVGIEVDLFSTIEAELMRTEGVKPFAPTQSVPGKESVAVSPELQEMANEEQAKKALKEKQRQDALAKKVIQDKLRQEEQAKKEALKAQKEALRQEAEAQKNLAKKRQLVAEKAQRKKYIAEYEALLAQEEALLVAEDAPARMTVPTREAATQTTQSFVSLQKEALCLDDETPAESINTQKILKALSEGKGEWFYTYTRKDSYGGTHQVKKWIQSRESLKNVPNSNFIMILQDEEESLEEYVTIFLVANTPLLKGAVFTGSAIVNVIEKGSDKIIESFRYYGDFICTENFYSDIGDELNFEFKKGYRTSIDTINDVVVEQEGTFDHDEPRCIKPSKRYASVAAWEQQTGRRVQPEQCAASQNRYGFYSGIKPHKSPVTPTPIGENAVEHQRGIK